MTKLEEMWEALLAYLPQAEAAGHGKSWAKMCSERTEESARLAAYHADDDDAYPAASAAWAAACAAACAAAAAAADWCAQKAIDRIKRITVVKETA